MHDKSLLDPDKVTETFIRAMDERVLPAGSTEIKPYVLRSAMQRLSYGLRKKKKGLLFGPIDCHGMSKLLIPAYRVTRSFMYSWDMPLGIHTVECYSLIHASALPWTTVFFGQRQLASQDSPDRIRPSRRSHQTRSLCCQLNRSISGTLRRDTRRGSTEPGQTVASTVGQAITISWS